MTSMAIHSFMLLLLFVTMHQSSAESSPSSSPYPTPYSSVRAAYWPSGSDFSTSSINTNYFTHIYYAFLEPDPADSFRLSVTGSAQTEITNFISGLRNRNPPVKTLLSIGGGSSNSSAFAAMASTPQSRSVFIKSTIQVARHYGFDGLDLDWEFPDTPQDMSNLALLFQEWSRALVLDSRTQRKPRLLLTAAVYYANTIKLIGNQSRSYPAEAIRKYLDWASPMNFDYHGAWSNFTGVNAALFDPKSNISTHYGIGSWIRAGVPPSKLVMGLPLYGRTWKLEDPNVHGIGAPAVGPATDTDGTMDYDRILEFNKENGATVVYDGLSVSYYSYAGTSWITYDDVRSIKRKVQFARSLGLNGYFFGPLIRTWIGPSPDKLQIHGLEGTKLLAI
ncbi:class V chitinase CHIT5a [Neltuma alba]|uniref:class V chitinase CHIT5a n=1 Tax=Neltuma alba TaxID=207710 RepID=UPI0010A4B2C1|nr:class V chitinase CHIT5a-like [Prosopis alba]